jgi:hypothetical protein
MNSIGNIKFRKNSKEMGKSCDKRKNLENLKYYCNSHENT